MGVIGHMVTVTEAIAPDPTPERRRLLLREATRLFLHYGFEKTTVAEVAAAAGVSKGAVYLAFASKDALLEALILQEMQTYARDWVEAVEADPEGGRIGGMYRCALRALSSNPLMAALLRRDARIFGHYLRKPGGLLAASRSGTSRKEFVEAMQAAGAIRPDVNPAVTAHIMNMLSYGLVAMAEHLESHELPPTEDLLEGIAELLDRALTPADGGNGEAGKALVRQIYEAGAARLARAQAAKA